MIPNATALKKGPIIKSQHAPNSCGYEFFAKMTPEKGINMHGEQ